MAIRVSGNELSRRGEFRGIGSLVSESCGSEGEKHPLRLSGTRQKQKRLMTFQELVNEMSTNTRKLEEETSGLLRDLVSPICVGKITLGPHQYNVAL